MADDNTIIEGTVKFRDGKKWKSRWCVMRKLSPVADCVHLQLYRDSKARCAGAASKASLSLQHYLGSEAGFTLDKHSNTLALVCRDLVAILAFETRERLIQWQVKVSAHLGEPRHYLVLVGGAGGAGGAGNKRLPAGPARLHLHERRFALTAGVPPRLLGIWELPHLRRYGVVEGRFCFEGGSHCGKGEGLHVLITDQAKELARDFDLASQGRLSPRRRPNNFKNSEGADSPKSHKAYRPDTRLSELNTIDHSLPPIDIHNYEEGCEETGAISPYWPSAERTNFQDMGHGDTASVNETVEEAATWNGVSNVTLERCMSCISKLGALSRSSTAALTPGAKHFNPAWTMEPVHETLPTEPTELTQHCDILLSATDKTDDACHCPTWPERPPERPPKPTRLELNLNRKPVPLCRCSHSVPDDKLCRVGPYENYDVPKVPHQDEYYDTPKRLKECLTNELFKVTKSSTSNAVILKKPCGCLLKFGKRRREPTIVDSEENFQPASCPCQRVTDWANNWIKLPYCRKTTVSSDNLVPNKENMTPNSSDGTALYATIDLSRKIRRKQRPCDRHLDAPESESLRGLTSSAEIDDGPLANYENLSFALSLEHYENAKDLLRKVGVTQSELDAISANLNPSSFVPTDASLCKKCGHAQQQRFNKNLVRDNLPVGANDDYLMMEPDASNKLEQSKPLPAGYTPMSPIGGFAFNTKHPARSPISRLLEEKSASNPTLCEESRRSGTTDVDAVCTASTATERPDRIEYRKRSSSADSSRFLEDVKEFDGSIGSQGSTSSIETLRNIAVDGRPSTPCNCIVDNKHSDADSSEASKGARSRLPPARRSSSVPGKAGGNRDSSSSNDSGVSSCSLRRGELFELPLTTAAARRHYRSARRAAAGTSTSLPRRSRSTDPLSDVTTGQRERVPAKSSSAEAEVPVLTVKPLRGVMDTHSTSSGTSDMSDYIETLSICSSHSSTDTPITMRVMRQTTSTLRPRSGKEYGSLDPRLASAYRHPHHYTNLP
ncbi:uncharacterized protein LOC111354018 [Spodoptera litura]|uniref:Uncharacterized protein LOC111354018 n=1 Tax=Spodoptera litura TaxID=69820 RepID=A0A9J7IRB1_SPOLT|nr:uncharacterized protein LOC111354018 [Spodoptera litura]XP_022823047.1 uncharacterized protein LOC111354018 [Spodoptera litura]XP_022823048.1 uncharacterized protein LOC111354018 [Spodoptera litura]XP_022823049.1 uncharacterized protein LOC111354018 [Spodoptera litura]XP_022823050.1 uncharacterized protein LOC111354018 [Spodoptera litura]